MVAMKYCLILNVGTLISMLCTPGLTATITADQEAKIDAYITEIMQCRQIVGMNLAIVKNGEAVYTTGYGYADKDKNITVDEYTMFGIASVSKSFLVTLFAIEIARENSNMTWDSVVTDLLPDFRFRDRERTEGLTVKDLLAMRAGITDYLGPDYYNSMPDFTSHLQCSKPLYGMRETFCYVDHNYVLAALVLQEITGKGFDQLMREEILGPLGMNNTSPSWLDFNYPKYGQYAQEHRMLSNGTIRIGNVHEGLDPDVLAPRSQDRMDMQELYWGPVEGVSTTTVDLAKYMLFHLGMYRGDRIHPHFSSVYTILKEMYKSVTPINFHTTYLMVDGLDDVIGTWKSYDYGMGFWIGKHRESEYVQHGGTQFHKTVFTLFKEWDLGIYTSTNGISNLQILDYFANPFTTMAMVHYYIADVLNGYEPLTNITFSCNYAHPLEGGSECGKYDIYAEPPDAPRNLNSTRHLTAFIGTFSNENAEDIVITGSLENTNALNLTRGCEVYELFPTENKDEFAAVPISNRECYGCAEHVKFYSADSTVGDGTFTHITIDEEYTFTNKMATMTTLKPCIDTTSGGHMISGSWVPLVILTVLRH